MGRRQLTPASQSFHPHRASYSLSFECSKPLSEIELGRREIHARQKGIRKDSRRCVHPASCHRRSNGLLLLPLSAAEYAGEPAATVGLQPREQKYAAAAGIEFRSHAEQRVRAGSRPSLDIPKREQKHRHDTGGSGDHGQHFLRPAAGPSGRSWFWFRHPGHGLILYRYQLSRPVG